MTNIKEHTEKLKTIPKERWSKKVWKSLLGVALIAFGVWLDKNVPDVSNWVLYSCLIIGGYAVAGDIVRGLAGFAPAAGKDIASGISAVRKAIKGK